MEKSKKIKLDANYWILSYVDFMTVIMAFFISFTLIATKVAYAKELFIVKQTDKIDKQLSNKLSKLNFKIENTGYNGIRIIIPSQVNGTNMFKSDSYKIKDDFAPILDQLISMIVDSSSFLDILGYRNKMKDSGKDLQISIRVDGHTDSETKILDKSKWNNHACPFNCPNIIDHNMILSLRRAEEVKTYIAGSMVFKNKIDRLNAEQQKSLSYAIAGYGESKPLSDNDNDNRRVEVYLNIALNEIILYGCDQKEAINYNPKVTRNDGTCIFPNSDKIE